MIKKWTSGKERKINDQSRRSNTQVNAILREENNKGKIIKEIIKENPLELKD